jgi:hypothetical protein
VFFNVFVQKFDGKTTLNDAKQIYRQDFFIRKSWPVVIAVPLYHW